MGLPVIVDEFFMNEDWVPKIPEHKCYLYNFKKMGITSKEFAKIFCGKKAVLFEKPLQRKLKAVKCPWCDYNARDKTKHVPIGEYRNRRGLILDDHVYTHNKNPVDFQVRKFQQELYTLKLQYIRMGFHSATCFLVQHQCHTCVNPKIKDRPYMCSIPEAPRNRMRSLTLLEYPVKKLVKMRRVEWSILGVIVLLEV